MPASARWWWVAAEAVGDQAKPLNLKEAEDALERGDYGQCLQILKPLADAHPLPDPEGARVRLMMITAWMGRGDDSSAIAACRILSRSGNASLRQQAKQLLEVLEAPSLARPESWSMRLPDLEMSATGSAAPSPARRRRSRRPPPPPPPPTGPTRPPALGFAVLVTTVLLGVTLLLSGCMRLDADLSLTGPDRLQLTWEMQTESGHLLPWQERFETQLQHALPDLEIAHPQPGSQRITTKVQAREMLEQEIRRIVQIAAETSGLSLPTPKIDLQERNWLIALDQRLNLSLDSSALPDIPGLELRLSLDHGKLRAEAPKESQAIVLMTLHRWRWSALGLGSAAILVLLGLSLLLQASRRHLGFGFPELPP